MLAWRPDAGANLQRQRPEGAEHVAGQAEVPADEGLEYKSKKRALSRGNYRWYVYPGLGKRSANRYGPLIGSSDFYVTKR